MLSTPEDDHDSSKRNSMISFRQVVTQTHTGASAIYITKACLMIRLYVTISRYLFYLLHGIIATATPRPTLLTMLVIYWVLFYWPFALFLTMCPIHFHFYNLITLMIINLHILLLVLHTIHTDKHTKHLFLFSIKLFRL